jgi:hypothetical protein
MEKLNQTELDVINECNVTVEAAATKKSFVEPVILEPVDILKATAMFLQVSAIGDV